MKKITKYVLLTVGMISSTLFVAGCIDKADPMYITFEYAQKNGYTGNYASWKEQYVNKEIEFRLVDDSMEYKAKSMDWNFLYSPSDVEPSWYTDIVDGVYEFDVEQFYSVNFNSNCDTVVERQVVLPGEKAVEPQDITKDNYVFTGWLNNGTSYDFDSIVNQRVDLDASWYIDGIIFNEFTHDTTNNTYNLLVSNSIDTIDLNDYLETETSYTVNGSASSVVSLDEGINEFTIVNSEANTNGDTTFTLKVQRKFMYTITYTYEFDTKDDETFIMYVEEGDKLIAPNLDVVGYTYTDSFNYNDVIEDHNNILIKYEANTYTITFNTDGGSSVDTIDVLFNEKIQLPTSIKARHEFLGWLLNGEYVDIEEFIYSTPNNIVLTADWEENEFIIDFDANGGVVPEGNPTGYDKGNSEIEIFDATRVGYTFAGWFTSDGVEYTSIPANSTESFLFIAKWVANTYTISFNANGGEALVSVVIEYDSMYSLDTTIRFDDTTNYVFNGWYNNLEKINLSGIWTIASDITLTADWIERDYSITYVLNDGINNIDNPYGFNENEQLSLNVATRVGYTFNGWFYDIDCTNLFNNSVNDDITLYASFTANEYTINFDVNGGESLLSNTLVVTFDNEFTLAKTSKFGYIFIGWELNGELITGNIWNVASDVTLVAKYEEADFTITYVTYDGANKIENAQGFNTSEVVTLQDATDVDGYTFKGWFYDETFTEQFDNSKYENITLYAKYEANTYTISFVVAHGDANGEFIEDLTVTYNEEFTLQDAVFNGFEFVCWQLNGSTFTNGTWTLLNDIELVARLNIITYTISYDLNYGDFVDEAVYEYTWEDEFNIVLASRQLDTFNGWLFNNEILSFIAQGTYGDMNLVAEFTSAVFNLSYVLNGGNSITNISTFTFDDGEAILNRASHDEYFFSYWSIDEEGIVDATIWNQELLKLLVSTNVNVYAIYTDEPMENQIYTDVDHLGNEKTFIYFGSFPQTVVDDESLISTLSSISSRNENGYIEYEGNEYARLRNADVYSASYTFNNGNAINNVTEYFFKVELVKWNIFTEDDGTMEVLSEYILDNQNFNLTRDDSIVNGTTYYSNNYENSNIREYLNDYFYNVVFDTEQQDRIVTTTVVNSNVSTYGEKIDGEYTSSSINNSEYVSNDTQDKIYLLSYEDVTNTDLGYDDTIFNTTTRQSLVTDYALARGVRLVNNTSKVGFWWTRTAMNSNYQALYIGTDSMISYIEVNANHNGVRPAFSFI